MSSDRTVTATEIVSVCGKAEDSILPATVQSLRSSRRQT